MNDINDLILFYVLINLFFRERCLRYRRYDRPYHRQTPQTSDHQGPCGQFVADRFAVVRPAVTEGQDVVVRDCLGQEGRQQQQRDDDEVLQTTRQVTLIFVLKVYTRMKYFF
jgi:hypothetical protein